MSQPPNWHFPVNAPTPVNGSITIVPYDPAWPGLYERERTRIAAALGSRALEIHHVGSTSVPGLAAKPIIDILLVVENCANDAAYLPDLERAGYVLRIREPDEGSPLFTGTEPHRVFKGSDIDLNLHVWSRGSGEIERNLIFRDWLRANDDDRDLYQRVKLELASRNWDNIQQYADAKTDVIQTIRDRALAAGER
jgi:GrpB-like predicted nucleotidyltransferase (UPF0157 family)